MNRKDLEQRTLRFAVAVIEFVETLPKNKTGEVVEFQLVKAGTSIGANYREAGRAESTNDFIHKLAIVEKESAESCYWLELCEYAQLGDESKRDWLLKESRELLAIFTSSGRTSKANRSRSRRDEGVKDSGFELTGTEVTTRSND